MNNKICTSFICPCNNTNYVSKASFKQHQKTEKHLHWERSMELKELKIKLNKLEIENQILSTNNLNLKNNNEKMKIKINDLESINSLLLKNMNMNTSDNLNNCKTIPVGNLIDIDY
jgi:DNA polymerase III alpha subunit (gram-positive type)